MKAGDSSLTTAQRRRAFAWAYANGALWSLGNGLASTSLIVYLVRQLGAAGLGVGVVIAAPHIAGVLRLAAPALSRRVATRRAFCVGCYGGSALLLAAISQLPHARLIAAPQLSLIHVVALWCVYHLLEYAGTVVLWAWLGDLAPQRIRGRFIGRRERWMMLTRIAGMLAGGGFAYWWLSLPGSDPFAYSAPACLGAAAMMAAVLPLLRMPEAPPASYEGLPKPAKKGQGNTATALESRRTSLPELLRPLADRRMRWLLLFGVWFSVANGLTQSAQYLYPIIAVGLTLWGRNGLTAVMRLGQARLAPAAGRFVDRFGNRPLLIVSQLAVATGPLFFILAARLHWSWLAGAWIVWICYVGLNVGLPNLMLKLAGPRQKASYVAWYFALTGIVYGLASIAGGALYTYLERHAPAVSWGGTTLNYHELLLAAGFVLRVLAVVWLLPIAEPGARRWWKMLRLQSQKR